MNILVVRGDNKHCDNCHHDKIEHRVTVIVE